MVIKPIQPTSMYNPNQTLLPKDNLDNKKNNDTHSVTVSEPKEQYRPSKDATTIAKLKAESEQAYNHLRSMVEELLKKQGLTFRDVTADTILEVDEETRLEAQSLISEGGELSAENVSDRIVKFAKAISGGDKSKFDELKAAIQEGFDQAAKQLGGVLPEVSLQTYDLVMEKLDRWKEEP